MEDRSHERRIRRSMSPRTATRFYLDNVTERHGLSAMVFANEKGEFILVQRYGSLEMHVSLVLLMKNTAASSLRLHRLQQLTVRMALTMLGKVATTSRSLRSVLRSQTANISSLLLEIRSRLKKPIKTLLKESFAFRLAPASKLLNAS